MEKHNTGTPPEVKILDSKIEGPTRQHDNPVAAVDAERMIKFLVYGGAEGPSDTSALSEDENIYILNFIESGGVEDPHEQSNNSILSEEDKYIIRAITSGGFEGPGRRRVNPILTEEQEASWRE